MLAECGSIPGSIYHILEQTDDPIPRGTSTKRVAAFLDRCESGRRYRFLISSAPSGWKRNRGSFGGCRSFRMVRGHREPRGRSPRGGTPHPLLEVAARPQGGPLQLPRDLECLPAPEPSPTDPDLWPPLPGSPW